MKFVKETLEGHDVLVDIEMRTRHKLQGTMEDVVVLYSFTQPFIVMTQDADIKIINREQAAINNTAIGRVAISGSESSVVYYDRHVYGIFLYTDMSSEDIQHFTNTFFGKFGIVVEKSERNDWLVDGKKLIGSVSIPPHIYLLSFSAKHLDIDQYYNMDYFPKGKIKPSERMASLESLLGRVPTQEEVTEKVEQTIIDIFGEITPTGEHLPALEPEIYTEALSRYANPDWIEWGIVKIIEIDANGLIVNVYDNIPSSIAEGNNLLRSSAYSKEDISHKNVYVTEVKDGLIKTAHEYEIERE